MLTFALVCLLVVTLVGLGLAVYAIWLGAKDLDETVRQANPPCGLRRD